MNLSQLTLIPKKGVLKSRSEAQVGMKLLDFHFRLPVLPANMVCTINFDMAEILAKNNYLYILHRFYDYCDIFDWVKKMKSNKLFTSISVGTSAKDYEFLSNLYKEKLYPDLICIDIAHGHSEMMEQFLQWSCNHTRNEKIIHVAGNTCTPQGFIDLHDWGADIVKVGLASGSACSTWGHTGFGCPLPKAIIRAKEHFVLGNLMADGGVKTNGDIAKAIAMGASFVMAGGLFVTCKDSPAPREEGKVKYFGSASEENKRRAGLPIKHIEGTTILLEETKITYLEKLEEIEQDLKSAVSYSGGSSLLSLTDTKIEVVSPYSL